MRVEEDERAVDVSLRHSIEDRFVLLVQGESIRNGSSATIWVSSQASWRIACSRRRMLLVQ